MTVAPLFKGELREPEWVAWIAGGTAVVEVEAEGAVTLLENHNGSVGGR